MSEEHLTANERRTYHHGDLRAALVAAATERLESEGAVKLSLRSVARQAGVSHTAPYRHFKDKHELLEAVAAAGFRALEARLDTVAGQFPDDPRRQILEACRGYVAETVAHPERSHLMFGGFLDPLRRSEELRLAMEESFAKLVATVRRGEGNLFRDIPTRDLVLTLWSATHGLSLLSSADQVEHLQPGEDVETLSIRTIEHLLTGLARPTEPT